MPTPVVRFNLDITWSFQSGPDSTEPFSLGGRHGIGGVTSAIQWAGVGIGTLKTMSPAEFLDLILEHCKKDRGVVEQELGKSLKLCFSRPPRLSMPQSPARRGRGKQGKLKQSKRS